MTDDTGHDAVERRLVALEIRLSHHERVADDLSDVVARQAETIDLLSARLRRLQDRLREMEAGWGPSPQDDKPPPHY